MSIWDKLKGAFGKTEKSESQSEAPVLASTESQQHAEPSKPAEPSVADVIRDNASHASTMAIAIDEIRSELGSRYLKVQEAAAIQTVESQLAKAQEQLNGVHDVIHDQSKVDRILEDTLSALKTLMELLTGSVQQLEEALKQFNTAIDCRLRAEKADEAEFQAQIARGMVGVQIEEAEIASLKERKAETDQMLKAAAMSDNADKSGLGTYALQSQDLSNLLTSCEQRRIEYQNIIHQSNLNLTQIQTVPDPEYRKKLIDEIRAQYDKTYSQIVKERQEYQERYFEAMAKADKINEELRQAQIVVNDSVTVQNVVDHIINAENSATQMNEQNTDEIPEAIRNTL